MWINERKIVNPQRTAILLFQNTFPSKQLCFKKISCGPSSLYHRNTKFFLLKSKDNNLHWLHGCVFTIASLYHITLFTLLTTGFLGRANSEDPTCQYRKCKRYIQSRGREAPPEEGMATHSSILAWRISWTEEPGGLQSIGSQRVGCDWYIYDKYLYKWK